MDSTNEEELESPPERESRIMTVKIIKNLENKMETWINRLEAQVEKDASSV